MAIEITYTDNSNLRAGLLEQKRQVNNDFALKGVLALAGIVAGVAIILFLSSQFFAVGVGLALLSTFILYHLVQQCRRSNRVLSQAAAWIPLSE